ncbi:MAG: hypothetical protein CM1200mP2_32410 [Planctomycetaceae bacterium]|nr:MAG: hypothetical protein CM1200mP2_32410 [Planctomycetaceae bacterium]
MCQTIAAKPGSPVGQFRECRSGCVVEKVVVDQFGRGIPRFLLKADAGQHGPGLEVGRRILGNHLLEQLYGSLWVVSPASRSLFRSANADLSTRATTSRRLRQLPRA